MKFKYSQYPTPDGASLYRPSIPITFQNGSKSITVEALIDSGADFTVLPIEIAGVLGIKLNIKNKESFQGAGGNPFNVYPSPTKLEHILRQDGFRPINWKANVYFAESQPMILLGNKGFLDQFEIRLRGKQREIEIVR
ncbi:MAG: hypothetical protein A2V81_01640 [Candidatus Abawacabacteria bacterium RBG_16_42_10]|uniref:Peptidase A2 domain-containing protein n=1 Tax=Candidatus Abawacabacteria bacterium RBG_16_42_10 TaxID=1817814 RepID=A0A1F4XJA8_9BACT|nr:MAG: hypothetical protein A2V81_01640 [Candidatus Abawacabacteria bacterium RBG_16_42_10]